MNNKIQLRPVMPEDIPLLQQQFWPNRSDTEIKELVQRILKQTQQGRGQGIVIVNTKTIIGYGQITFWSKKAEIADLYIIESHRKKGLGTALIQYLIQLARDRHLPAVEIGVETDNWLALKLYQRLGFIVYQTITENPIIIYLSFHLQ